MGKHDHNKGQCVGGAIGAGVGVSVHVNVLGHQEWLMCVCVFVSDVMVVYVLFMYEGPGVLCASVYVCIEWLYAVCSMQFLRK